MTKSYGRLRLATAVWLLALGWPGSSAAAEIQRRHGAAATPPAEEAALPPRDRAAITGVRFLSWKRYTRVMLELTREATYDVRRLKEDAARNLPARVYIDIKGARMGEASRDPIAVDDGLLRQVRIGQHSHDVVRVVLDTNNLGSYNTFMMADPYRLIVDIYGGDGSGNGAPKTELGRKLDAPAPRTRVAKPAPAPPAANGLRKIVLDPGHGGKDPGAIGPGGVAEKDIVLSIAKKLADKLTAEMGVHVVLTRNDDRYVALEDRTATANAEDADLFISLHMNASHNPESRGIETYFLDNTTDEAAIRLAARENGTSRRNISDLQFILSDMTQNMKLEDSITLAHRLQGSMVAGMTGVMNEVRDLGVKKALFYVLVGARMPSVLVEMFFITHRSEGRAMARESHQDAMVQALFEGIEKFAQSNLVVKTL
jgi:N-acetylmuramoyl-L-alanine amidase